MTEANAPLGGLPSTQLNRLQSVMNVVARLVCSARKFQHITPLTRDLHWLPVRQRIEFKLATLIFRCLHGTAPQYLARELLRSVANIDSRRPLRSASTSVLDRRVTVGDRAFRRRRSSCVEQLAARRHTSTSFTHSPASSKDCKRRF